MDKWYSDNPEIVEAKSSGPVAAAFAVLMGMGLWQAAEKFNASPEEIEEIVQQQRQPTNSMGGLHWTDEQVAEWNRLKEEESKQKEETEVQNEKLAKDINILARTLWGEARGESEEGIKAVASSIWNRGNGNVNRMVQSAQKPYAYSMWNGFDWDSFEIKEFSGEKWDLIKSIATEMANGTFKPTGDYTHYYAPKGLKESNSNIVRGPDGKLAPKWAFTDKTYSKYLPLTDIGNHRFLKTK